MQNFQPLLFDVAKVPQGTPTFAMVIDSVRADATLSPTRKRDIVSGLLRVATVLGGTPDIIPANTSWLTKKLETIAPESIRISAQTWSNNRSAALAGLKAHGTAAAQINQRSQLSDQWQYLWATILASDDRTIKITLRRAVYFFNAMAVAPLEVTMEHFEAYRIYMVETRLKDPELSCRQAVNAWNQAVRNFPEWPRQTFHLPTKSKKYALALADFPLSFQNDMARYQSQVSTDDLFGGADYRRPLRASTIAQYSSMLVRFASILVKQGIPSKSIASLRDLVTIENARAGLRSMTSQNGNVVSPHIVDMTGLLRGIAKFYVKVSDHDQKILDSWKPEKELPEQRGLTEKNRTRLRPLKDKEMRRRLVKLPDRLFEKAAQEPDLKRSALLREEAIAIAILLSCPIRRKNLFEIHLEQHLSYASGGQVQLLLRRAEVKNAVWGDFEIPTYVVKMIHIHLATRTHLLCEPGTLWLFPRRDGTGPTSATYIADRVQRRIRRELGIEMNVHLFRHFAAMRWLEANPGDYEGVRRILCQQSSSRVAYVYAGFDSDAATQRFAEIIELERRN